jgi:hypothetical protein
MNSGILSQRLTVELDEPVCLFLIGMRVNRWWKPHRWLPVMRAMTRMMRELEESGGELGFLGSRAWIGNPTITVQYWKSFEALESYAVGANHRHRPAWRDFNRRVGSNGDVGIWHETYRVAPGTYECIYNNMPAFGLGGFGRLVPAVGPRESAANRISGDASRPA